MNLVGFLIYALLLPLISTSASDNIKSILLYLHAIGLTCIVYNAIHSVLSRNKDAKRILNQEKDMYGLKHTLLNLQVPPATLWFNVGLWTDNTNLYPEACENLISKVARYANVQKNKSVLDVGFGCGDSCKYLEEKLGCRVTGITNELSQVRMANERLSADQKQRIHLLHGSAENLDDLIQPSTKVFDHIICIDSAYHYNTRWDFFKSAFKYLKGSGGTLGIFDFTLHPALFQSLKQSSWKLYAFKALCNFIHVPSDNLLATPEEYKQRLYDAGFKNVQLETVATEQVFDGLSRFMRQQLLNASKYGIHVNLSDKLFLSGASFVFNILAKNDWLTPLLVSAEKQESAT